MKTITLGRIEMVRQWEDTLDGRELVETAVPRVVVWLNEGTEEDAEKARRYAKAANMSEGEEIWHVFTFDVPEPDPIGRTKELMMKGRDE